MPYAEAVTTTGSPGRHRRLTPKDQQILTADQQEALSRVLSEPRLTTYLLAAGHDWDRGWQLYLWNARLGEAFHLPIQTAEVCLRNQLCRTFTSIFGRDWGSEDSFLQLLDRRQLADIATVKQRLKNRALANGQIVAGLSFGFWVGMLQRRYFPTIWSSNLNFAFPHLSKGLDREAVFTRFAEISILRNRISHHEPLLKLNVPDEYNKIMGAIDWMCAHTGPLIRPHVRLSDVIREKP